MAVASRANWRFKPPYRGTPLSSYFVAGSLVAAVIEEVGRGSYPDVENTGRWLVGPESYRSKFRIFDAGSSHHGGAVLRQQLATQQASATLAAACYQPTTSQTPQEDCPTPTHPHATIFTTRITYMCGMFFTCIFFLIQVS